MPFEAAQARKDFCLSCLSKSAPTIILWKCKLFVNTDSFVATFVVRSVSISRICRVKKNSKSNRAWSIVSQGTRIRCQYDELALWSCSNSKRSLPFLPGSRTRSFAFLMEEDLDGGQPPPAKRTRWSPTGVEKEARSARRCEKARLAMARRRSQESEGQAASRRVSNQERMANCRSTETAEQVAARREREQQRSAERGSKRPPCRLMPGGQETKSVQQIAEQVSMLFLLKLEISVIAALSTNGHRQILAVYMTTRTIMRTTLLQKQSLPEA